MRRIYRISDRDESPILVEFNSMRKKLDFLHAGKPIFQTIGNKRIIIRSDSTPYFRKMLKIARAAMHDGKLHRAWITSNGLALQLCNGETIYSIASLDELNSIIDCIPKPMTKPSRQRRRSSKVKKMKGMPRKNKRRRGNHPRNKSAMKSMQMKGICRIKRRLINVFFLFFLNRSSKWLPI